MSNLILASSSIYRKELLQRLNLEFSCYSPAIDEAAYPGELPEALAIRLAEEKARTVAERFPNAVAIGADQVAELNGEFLGKPGSHDRAKEQLMAQAGKTVLFHSGLALVQQQPDGSFKEHCIVDTTSVTFRQLSAGQIEAYLQAEQPYDCAGSFKAEGLGISLFSEVRSNDPSSLIGLPLIRLCSGLKRFDIKVL